jgi:hypothetical protein
MYEMLIAYENEKCKQEYLKDQEKQKCTKDYLC